MIKKEMKILIHQTLKNLLIKKIIKLILKITIMLFKIINIILIILIFLIINQKKIILFKFLKVI